MANPQLRDDLIIKRQVQGQQIYYIFKDPVEMEYFRFAENEYFILELLDGKKNLKAILKNAQHILPELELEIDDIKDFLKSIKKMGLLVQTEAEKNLMLIEKMREARKSKILSKKGSLFYKRFPLVDPNNFFDRIIDRVRFFWSPAFIYFSLTTMALALIIVYFNWTKVQRGAEAIFSVGGMTISNLIMLWIIVLVIIGIHECGHGLTCKNFGGEVHEMGVLLLFFQPCLYCNVSDAWTFDNKSHKLWVTFAGGYIEFFLGSIAVFIWVLTQEKTLINTLMFQAFTVCSISAVIFNFNPLIKLDGYYAFSDYFELPNLKNSSIDYIKYLVITKIFKMPSEFPEVDEQRVKTLFAYGICASIYMTSLVVGIFFMVQGMLVSNLGSIGVLLSFYIAIKMFKGPIMKIYDFLKEFFIYHKTFFSQKKVFIPSILSIILLFYMVFFAKYDLIIQNDCNLEFYKKIPVRSLISSYISKICVIDDQLVEKCKTLFNLNDPDLLMKLKNTKIEKKIIELSRDSSYGNNEIPEAKKNTILIENKNNTLKDIKNKLKSFKINAPFKGYVINIDKDLDQGKKLTKGQMLCELVSIKEFLVEVPVDERDIGDIKKNDKVKLKFYALPIDIFNGRVYKIGTTAEKKGLGRTFKVKIIVENKNNKLRNGMSGIARIIPRKTGLLSLCYRKISRIFRTDLLF